MEANAGGNGELKLAKELFEAADRLRGTGLIVAAAIQADPNHERCAAFQRVP